MSLTGRAVIALALMVGCLVAALIADVELGTVRDHLHGR